MRYLLWLLPIVLIFSGVASAQSPDPIIPPSGTWEVTVLDEQNNCPTEITRADVWVPADGSQHSLTFSTLENVPLDLHRIVAPEEIADDPAFFFVSAGDYNQYEIIPQIQTQPYTYRYAILDEGYIVLEYVQTLALSDCVLTATYSITLVSSETATLANLENWGVGGDAGNAEFLVDESALCATDQAQGVTWFFTADEDFVRTVNASYGQTLSYDLRITSGNLENPYSDFDIELVVGNGIVLHYTFDDLPTDEWTHFEVKLDETAGWVDIDGSIPTDDPELFPQIVQDITQINIRGEYITGSDSACIANVQISSEMELEVTNADNVDLSAWTVGGLPVTELFFEFADAPDGALCTGETMPEIVWALDADEAFVNQLNNSYGQTIRFETRTQSEHMTEPISDINIELVIGNGIVLQYTFDELSVNAWTEYAVEMSETAGWVDVDGGIPTDDAELFPQIVQDITQFRIYGTHIDATGSTCIANVGIDNAESTPETGADVQANDLQSGEYMTVITDVTEGCTGFLPVGTAERVNVEFSTMGDGSILAMLIEGVPQPVLFYATEIPSVFQAEGDGLGAITILSPSQFSLQHTYDACQTVTEATLAE